MRVPFPVHIPLVSATGFAVLLFAVQLYQGTSLSFAIYSFLFIVVATLTFNLAGGFSRPSGAYVFFYALLGVILGLIWKAVLGERADSNLLEPKLTIQVFLGGITAMLVAVFISRRLTRQKGLLQNLIPESRMQNATVGCMVTGLVLAVIFQLVPKGTGSFLSALAQVNRFLPMAIIFGVLHETRKSGGTRSINIPVIISAAGIFAVGLLGYSKEGIFTPILCWYIAAGSQRYKVSVQQVVGGVLLLLVMVIFLVPYAQYGRNAAQSPLELLSNPNEVRREYLAGSQDNYEVSGAGYFNSPQGFADRLQMISPDDGLVYITERGSVVGFYPIILYFENLVPHVFWPNKATFGGGNLYAHEIGGLPEDDTTTGISFSPSGEAFHLMKWPGVFILAPLLWIMLFVTFDSLCGDVRKSPWGLLVIAVFAHVAPEGMLGGIIYQEGFLTIGIIFAAVTAAYVMPVVGTFIVGPEKTGLVRIARLQSFQRLVRSNLEPGSIDS